MAKIKHSVEIPEQEKIKRQAEQEAAAQQADLLARALAIKADKKAKVTNEEIFAQNQLIIEMLLGRPLE